MRIRILCAALFALLLILTMALIAAPATTPVTKDMGTPISAITVEIYSDFQCPHCKLLHETWMPSLIKNYVLTGRVHLIQHEFPLPQHPFAKTAAYYACAADRVGKYGAVADVLFQKQDDWGKDGKVDETACSVLTHEEAVKVRALTKDPAIAAQVQKDLDLGAKVPLRETPTVIVTYKGRKYPVNVGGDYSYFAKLLDSLH
jgi:protein-disulfide isomerase